ncbi:MAG TPA: hypothetical protein VGH32_03525 [Pirellulales bacterium]
MPNLTIYPYLYEDACWVFDDKRVRLKEEAFVLGTGEIISGVVEAKAIPNAASGFALTFGVEPFDHDVELNWITPAEAAEARHLAADWMPRVGNWYRGTIFGREMVGWLCPALFLYFPEAPKKIYAKAEPLPAGVDPIWHIDKDDPLAKWFVSPSGEIRDH